MLFRFLDEGTIHKLSKNKIPHHKGWVIDKSILSLLEQKDNGSWRLNKQK